MSATSPEHLRKERVQKNRINIVTESREGGKRGSRGVEKEEMEEGEEHWL